MSTRRTGRHRDQAVVDRIQLRVAGVSTFVVTWVLLLPVVHR